MLELARKGGQSILIFPSNKINPDMTVAELFVGGPIEIRILYLKSHVRLAIQAPSDLRILRAELAMS